MGVHGLWDLLAPVGRRVSVETLAGKRLAIDASIWMVQFMKAMRDEKGEMVRNAHLIGFFRRICKLLFLRTKPVFVFDGGTPALKRRTVIARRRQRENAQTKIRKTAEKLLMNHIKTMRLKNLADDLKDQRAKTEKGKAVMSDQSNTLEKNDDVLKVHSQEMIDEMLVASILAEECGGIDGCTSAFKGTSDIKNGDTSTSASGAAFLTEDDDENEEDDEEMILPTTNGNVDPAVLAALPPSMQLDLLGQMRERLMAENRQKYQKVKKAPQKFSELQIEAYLKTVAFRREINEVQRAAAGKGVAGVQTSRIASEANREFIFSSSFSGDKQLLVSGGTAKEPEGQQRPEKKDSSLDALNSIVSATKSNLEAGETTGEPVGDFGNEVEMFIDENGRKRLSRRRAMGIRMTRDLQRNIELMREHEQETAANNLDDGQNKIDEGNNLSSKTHREAHSLNAVDNFQGDNVQNCIKNTLLEAEIHEDEPAQRSQSCINISFNDDEVGKLLDGDDEFFSCLVAGNQVSICSADNSASDCEWEDGVICKESSDINHDNKLTPQDGKSESDVDWEEGISLINDINKSEVICFDVENSQKDENAVELQEEAADIREFVPEFATNSHEVSKGSVEEETALQEAIKRSLEDLTSRKTSSISPELENSDYVSKSALDTESQSPEPSSELANVLYDNKRSLSFVAESDGSNVVSGKGYVPETASSTCTTKESAQIGDIAKNGTNIPTRICGTDSLHVTFVKGTMKKKEVASTCNLHDLSDSGSGKAVSILEERESGTDVKINMAEEDTFLADLQEQGNGVKIPGSIDEDDIIELVGARLEDELLVLDQEHKNLGDEQRKLERNADSVNAEMFVECQELLQMFGLPYIIAPMEAEAQCAYMELANLVDGVVTDDSDVLLFGSRSVYKNIFDDRKYVETYLMKDIESELGLKREKLIRMAMLLGSDYTEGVSGIGIVNAIEVVTAFPEEDGLRKFREWVESPDPTILGEVGVQSGLSSKRRGSKTSRTDKSNSKSDLEGQGVGSQENEDNQSIDDNERIKQAFMDKHRNVSKNWHIPGSFPSDAVVTAYVAPQVDKSTEPFAWGKPDIFVLRKLCWEKFGWASQKADELLLPVLKEYNKHETQLRLEAFYTFNEKFAKIRSKRINQAVKGITGKRSLESARTDDLKESPEKKNRRKTSTRDNKSKNEEHFTKNNDCVVGDMGSSAKRPKSQRKRRDQNDGSKRGRGRRTAKTVQKDDSNSEVDETRIHIASSSSDERDHELHAEKVHMADSVRRSKRARKDVNYVDKDEGNEEQTDFRNKSSEKCGYNEAAEQNLSHSQTVPGDNVELTPLVPSPEDDLAGDYILSGGFCANEDEPEIENDELENEETSFDKDYLQMGGGFCVNEEDEEDQNEDQTIDNRIDRSDSPLSPESASDTVQPLSKAQEGSSSGKKDTDISITADNAEESNAPRFVSAFSAIPYLKRKRKK